MRTTVNIRDEALEMVRERARERGISLGEVVSEAILAAYRDKPVNQRREKIVLPVGGRGGLRPGVSLDDSAGLRDLMEET